MYAWTTATFPTVCPFSWASCSMSLLHIEEGCLWTWCCSDGGLGIISFPCQNLWREETLSPAYPVVYRLPSHEGKVGFQPKSVGQRSCLTQMHRMCRRLRGLCLKICHLCFFTGHFTQYWLLFVALVSSAPVDSFGVSFVTSHQALRARRISRLPSPQCATSSKDCPASNPSFLEVVLRTAAIFHCAFLTWSCAPSVSPNRICGLAAFHDFLSTRLLCHPPNPLAPVRSVPLLLRGFVGHLLLRILPAGRNARGVVKHHEAGSCGRSVCVCGIVFSPL